MTNPYQTPEYARHDSSKKHGPESWRWASNNSIMAEVGMNYTPHVDHLIRTGEPGFVWLNNMRTRGRMVDPEIHTDMDVMGVNPCFAGDTLIAVADGRMAVPLKQLAEEGNDVPVYSVNEEGKVQIKWARNPRLTGIQKELVAIKLDDGSVLRVTPDHKMQLLDGTPVLAKDLQPGDSLPRFMKRPEKVRQDKSLKYIRVYGDVTDSTIEKLYEHRLVMRFHHPDEWDSMYDVGKQNGWIKGGVVVHHKDHNPLNNAVENLELMYFKDHAHHHGSRDNLGKNNPMWGRTQSESARQKISAKSRERFADPEYRERHRLATLNANDPDRANRMSRVIREYNRQYWLEQEKNTDLDTVWIDDVMYAVKYCEICKKKMIISWGRREITFCSRSCINMTEKHTKARLAGQKIRFESNQRQKLHEQVRVYQDLKQQLQRDPMKKEWEVSCKGQNIPWRIRSPKASPTDNPYAIKSFKHLKQLVASYNHRVVSVEQLEQVEDVYNLTVEDNHTVGILLKVDTSTGYADGIFTFQCGEQQLHSTECCTLGEVFPSRHDSYEELQETLKCAYLYVKTVTLLPTHHAPTNAVMLRNRRVGLSMTGIPDVVAKIGLPQFQKWCDNGYKYVKELDRIYSDWLCVRNSVRLSTVKPGGSVPLLPGVSPGVHFPHARHYIRRVRIQDTSELLPQLEAAGYPIEPDKVSANTMVVSIPIHEKNFVKGKDDVTIWEQLHMAAFMQRWWSDNGVSVTVTFKEHERDQILPALEHFQYDLKAVSFLPADGGIYEQAPYETITKDQYNDMVSRIKPMHLMTSSHEVTEAFCTTDRCEIPVAK